MKTVISALQFCSLQSFGFVILFAVNDEQTFAAVRGVAVRGVYS